MLYDFEVEFGKVNFFERWKSIAPEIIDYARCDLTLNTKKGIKDILNLTTITDSQDDKDKFLQNKAAVLLGKILRRYVCIPPPRSKKPDAPKTWNATPLDVQNCFVNWNEVRVRRLLFIVFEIL